MQTIIFFGHKQKIAEFRTDNLQFEKQDGGLLLTAEGEMVFQDTPSVENMVAGEGPVHVAIEKDGATVIGQFFQITVFVFEADNIAVLLSPPNGGIRE